MKGFVAVTLSALMLAGCANKPVSFADASPVPTERIYAFRTPGADTAEVKLTRDSGFIRAAFNQEIFVDGKHAASIGQGESAVLHLPAGVHILGARDTKISDMVEREITVQAGQTYRRRVAVMFSTTDITPTAF